MNRALGVAAFCLALVLTSACTVDESKASERREQLDQQRTEMLDVAADIVPAVEDELQAETIELTGEWLMGGGKFSPINVMYRVTAVFDFDTHDQRPFITPVVALLDDLGYPMTVELNTLGTARAWSTDEANFIIAREEWRNEPYIIVSISSDRISIPQSLNNEYRQSEKEEVTLP